tara:strand:+ start:908 stop:1219 length:312 start_codon:yes stop_codon:yes gene_type:complete
MATTKVKGTSAKIKELTGVKPEKITDEQLTKLKALVSDINKMHIELGVFEGRKHKMLEHLMSQQGNLIEIQKELEDEYGTLNIDINDGSIKYEEENGEVNKED